MIVEDRMTGKELLENFHKDEKVIVDFINDVIDKNISKIRRALKIKKQHLVRLKTRSILVGDVRYYVVAKVFLAKDSNCIKWLGTFYNISLNKSGKKILIHYAIRESPISLHIKGILENSEEWSVSIYENHLLNRYRERYLGLGPGEISFEDLAEKFMNRDGDFLNGTSLSNSEEEVKKGSRLEMRRGDGIFFGVLEDPEKYRYITYITPEMATREGQDYIREDAMKELEKEYKLMEDLKLLK